MATIIRGCRRVISRISSRKTLPTLSTREYSNGTADQGSGEFDMKLLDILVCPLSKKPLRYDAEANELISDEIDVAYPIENGIPNLVPTDARILSQKKESNN